MRRQGNHHPSDDRSVRTQIDPNHEHVMGCIGEMAVGHTLRLPFDDSLRRGGDNKIDFRFGGCTIDVKTRLHPHYNMLIRTTDLIRKRSHFYVHAYVMEEEKAVGVHGYVNGIVAGQQEILPAFNQKMAQEGVMNYNVSPTESAQLPISDLNELVQMLREKSYGLPL